MDSRQYSEGERRNCVCPKCGGAKVGVADSRLNGRLETRRRRYCNSCGEKWTTLEIPLATVIQYRDMEATLANMRRLFKDTDTTTGKD